jgi:hypothetical protein
LALRPARGEATGDRAPRASANAVSAYLAECARFWTGNESLIDEWRGAIARGEPTRLERSFASGETVRQHAR